MVRDQTRTGTGQVGTPDSGAQNGRDRKTKARARRVRERLPRVGTDTQVLGDEHDETGAAKSQLRIVAGRFVRQPRAMGAAVVFVIVAVGCLILSETWKYKYNQITSDFARIQYKIGPDGKLVVAGSAGSPTGKHPFGVDQIGHDVLSQVVRGTLSDIKTALLVAVLVLVIGTALGSIAGYYRRWIDSLLMRATDIVLSVPLLVILIVLSNRWHSTWLVIALIIGLLAWTYLARLVRADFLSLREREFVEAARAIGATDRRIIVRHMLPNAIGPIIVNGTLTVAQAIVIEATLSFLGLGIQPPDVSLGYLIAAGQNYAQTQWWLFAFPAIFIVVLILSINFIGDGLREAFDPRKVRVRA